MRLRRVKYLVTLLLVLSAFAATTAQSNLFTPVPQVNAASGFLDLTPTKGPVGLDVRISGQVTTGVTNLDASCSISSPTSSAIITVPACAVNGGGSTTGNFTGSFTVGVVPLGQYVIEVTACAGNNGCAPSVGDFVQAVFNVTSGPQKIFLSPATAKPGTHILVNGTGFLLTDDQCILTSSAAGVIATGTSACVIRDGTGLANASFTVGNVLPGQYVIQVTGNQGDSAAAILNVVSGPSIFLSPATGQPGAHVSVNGTGFLPTDQSCSISSISLDSNGHGPILAGTAGCVIRVGSGLVNASFTIGNLLPGQYVIEVTGCGGNNGCTPSVGDFATAILNVVKGPAIFLTPATGRPGTHVVVNGTGFLPTDTQCILTASAAGVILPGTSACVIRAGTGLANASFTIGNVLPGQYVIQVTGDQGDEAAALLNVISGPAIFLTPATGKPGTHVVVNGTGFLPTDTQCILTASAAGVILPGTSACVIRAGTGLANASFTIGNVLPGQYVIQVTGTQGDDAAAILNVVSGPAIFLTPASARTGAHILVNGTGFLPTDTSCSVSSPSIPIPILSGTSGCAIRVGTGLANASFIIPDITPGQYVIEITGCGGNNGCAPSVGDFAQAILNVVSGPSIFLSPGSIRTGGHVLVNGTGFQPADTLCTLVSPVSNLVNPILPGTAACVIRAGTGLVNASFTVANVPPGQYVIEVDAFAASITTVTTLSTSTTFISTSTATTLTTTSTTIASQEFAQAILNVVGGPAIFLTPATGSPGTHVSVNGTGFLPTDTQCIVGASAAGVILPGTDACVIRSGSGLANASFTIGNVLPGQYVIQVTGNGGDSAAAILNVVKGPAIFLTPATGQPGAHILVNGTGFLPTDTQCILTASAVGVILPGTDACVIRAGTGLANASFTIGNVLPGQYVIQVTGNRGDSAAALLNVVSGPSIFLTPATGQPGTHVSVNGTGFLPTDQSCSISSISVDSNGHGPILAGTAGCVIRVGSGLVNASFTIGNLLPGQYVIEITGCGGNNGCTPSVGDFATAILNVVSGPAIFLTPASARTGAHILVNGTGFLPTDTQCILTSSLAGVILVNTAACVIRAGTGLTNASFTIGNVLPGQYVIQVTGNKGDSAAAILNVVSGPAIFLTPATGQPGAHILVNGTGFLPTDTQCILSASLGGVILVNTAACVIRSGTGLANASFTIGNVLPGQYVIQVTGNGGDSAAALLNVVSGPAIFLTPATGQPGAHVLVNGTGFLPTDTQCVLTASAANVILPGTAACVIRAGSGLANASFTIGNVLPGQYVIQVTGNQGDSAAALLNVVSGPAVFLSPATGSPGTHTSVNGTGFLPTDQSCSISSISLDANGHGPVSGGTASCVVRVGTGLTNASFTIGNVLPGQYVIEVTGCKGNNGCSPSVGDFATAILNVVGGPRLTLNPGTGMIGQEVLVNGTGFLPTDQSCSISGGTPNLLNPVLPGSAGCAIAVGTGIVNGSFIIGNVPPGQYVIEITGCLGNLGCAPSAGDFATKVLAVVSSGKTLILSATNSSEESTVSFLGTGLSPSDSGCMLLSYNARPAPGTLDTNLITSPTCSIVSPGVAQGTFIVSPYATTNIQWNLTVRGTPAQDLTPFAIFNVTADVIVTPTSGTVNSVFTYTGSGFSSTANTCTATVFPPFPVIPSTTTITLASTTTSTTSSTSTFTTTAVSTFPVTSTTASTTIISGTTMETSTQVGPGCYVSAGIGQISGSLIVPGSASPGTYGVIVTATNATGFSNTATGVFTVGTPSALVVLNPATVAQGQSVGAAGFGFNPADAYCTVSSSTGTALFGSVTPTCQISGGYASAAFTVSATASGGYYLISIIACEVQPSNNVCPAGATLDFASNFLGVTLATTVTTFSSTTTSSSSTTSLSTTTTSVATSFSFSSTTYSTTGILFTTYTHFTVTTVPGQTTTVVTQTSSTTNTQTTVTFSTTTQFTTVPCGPLPCGFQTQPTPFNPAPGIDSTGLLAALLLLIPMLLRRLFT